MPAPASSPVRPAEADAESTARSAGAAARGGIWPWLPLLANLLLMPLLAYGTVSLFILPKLEVRAVGPRGSVGGGHAGKETEEKQVIPLSAKIIVNVAGTMGSRYLLANLSLVGTRADLRSLIEKNDAELRDAAAGALSVKTINDLEKPGARNLIRTELISVFNNILGNNALSDIYLTEFAIQ